LLDNAAKPKTCSAATVLAEHECTKASYQESATNY